MLRDRARYDAALEWYSRNLMQHVEYKLNQAGELRVVGDTELHYRYPDLTRQTEELFAFVKETVERDFTAELEYLAAFDVARRRLAEIVDMPDARLDLFIRLAIQGEGRLSGKKRATFAELSDDEVQQMETIVKAALAQISAGDRDDERVGKAIEPLREGS